LNIHQFHIRTDEWILRRRNIFLSVICCTMTQIALSGNPSLLCAWLNVFYETSPFPIIVFAACELIVHVFINCLSCAEPDLTVSRSPFNLSHLFYLQPFFKGCFFNACRHQAEAFPLNVFRLKTFLKFFLKIAKKMLTNIFV